MNDGGYYLLLLDVEFNSDFIDWIVCNYDLIADYNILFYNIRKDEMWSISNYKLNNFSSFYS